MFATWCFVSTLLVATQASAPTDPLSMYTHHAQKCVHENNIKKYHSKTPAECAELCTTYGAKCMGFEYGVAYGGTKGGYKPGNCQLQSSADTTGCDGNVYNLDFYEKSAGAPLADALTELTLWSQTAELDTAVSCEDYAWLENCGSDPSATYIPTNGDLLKFTQMVTAKYYALFGSDPTAAAEEPPEEDAAPAEPQNAVRSDTPITLKQGDKFVVCPSHIGGCYLSDDFSADAVVMFRKGYGAADGNDPDASRDDTTAVNVGDGFVIVIGTDLTSYTPVLDCYNDNPCTFQNHENAHANWGSPNKVNMDKTGPVLIGESFKFTQMKQGYGNWNADWGIDCAVGSCKGAWSGGATFTVCNPDGTC